MASDQWIKQSIFSFKMSFKDFQILDSFNVWWRKSSSFYSMGLEKGSIIGTISVVQQSYTMFKEGLLNILRGCRRSLSFRVTFPRSYTLWLFPLQTGSVLFKAISTDCVVAFGPVCTLSVIIIPNSRNWES